MRCENVSPLLMLAADGSLGPLAAWRLRRHLAVCSVCAAERDAFGRLDARLCADDPAAGFVPVTHRREHSPLPAPPVVRRRILLAGVSAAVVGTVGAIVVFAPGPIAFAQVQQAMADVRTAEWTQMETWFPSRGDGENTGRRVAKTRVRARLDPPALLLETTVRQKINGAEERFTGISLKTPDGFRTYQSRTHEIVLLPYDLTPHKGAKVTRAGLAAGLRHEILSKLMFTPPTSERKIMCETRKVTLNGKPALQFTFRTEPKQNEKEDYVRRTLRLWADPETKRVLRSEREERDAATDALTHLEVSENIHCDIPVPDAAFALNAPAGTPVYHENYWWANRSSATLTRAEKVRVNRLIDETYAGVLASDWKRAAAGWDLGYAAALPGSPVPSGGLERWLRRKVVSGRQYKVMRRLTVSGINDAPYTRVLGFGDAMVPPGAPHLVAVTLTLGSRYRDGLQECGAETFYFRRDTTGNFRIVGWQYPEGDRERSRRQWLEKQKGRASQ